MNVIVLLVMVVIAHIVNGWVPWFPAPIIQVGLGIAAALLPFGIRIPLEPELFFIVFIAPLLFNDGKLTPRDELWQLKASILLLALGLVFITVIVLGWFIHWMIPAIPLPAAFALAAILSPTDAVAVGASAKRIRLPRHILRLLQGEALMNDASGLVAFKFAVAAMVTGVFSWGEAAVSFGLISIGGLLCGAVSAYLITRLQRFLSKYGMEDATAHMLLQILAPFLIYYLAEELHVSGILAVVAAGIVYAIERDHTTYATPAMQNVSSSTWSVIMFILNGLVFLLLGLHIHEVSTAIFSDASFDNGLVIGYIIAISLALIAIRFLWVYWFVKETGFRTSLMTAISGVRGAVTLAGAFSIPYTLQDGSEFPGRSLLLFLAAGVIVFTLVTASVLLPLLTQGQQDQVTGNNAKE